MPKYVTVVLSFKHLNWDKLTVVLTVSKVDDRFLILKFELAHVIT